MAEPLPQYRRGAGKRTVTRSRTCALGSGAAEARSNQRFAASVGGSSANVTSVSVYLGVPYFGDWPLLLLVYTIARSATCEFGRLQVLVGSGKIECSTKLASSCLEGAAAGAATSGSLEAKRRGQECVRNARVRTGTDRTNLDGPVHHQ